MGEFGFWFSTGFITVLVSVIWFGAKRLIDKFDELIKSIDALTIQNQSHNDQLKVLNDTVKEHRDRLNKHGDRIRDIELNKVK